MQARKDAQKVAPLTKIFNSVRRQVYDPNLIGQKYDNEIFKMDKEQGKLLRGQKDNSADRSVVSLMRGISNPTREVIS